MASPNDPSPSKYVSKLKLRALNAEQQEDANPATVYQISDLKDKHSDKKYCVLVILHKPFFSFVFYVCQTIDGK